VRPVYPMPAFPRQFSQQHGFGKRVGLVVGKLVDHLQTSSPTLRPVAASQVSRGTQAANRRGDGRRIRVEVHREHCPTPDSLLFTNHEAPGPMWHFTHSTVHAGNSDRRVLGCITVWQVSPQNVTESM